MIWLLVAIFAYFILAIASLFDKYLLGGSLSNPKIYAFYVGILGSLAFLLIPLGFFIFPGNFFLLVFALLAGSCQILGIYFYFESLKKFEPSRVIPAIGGMQPLFSFGMTWFFGGGKEILDAWQIIGFFLMVAGSVIIVYEQKAFGLKSLRFAVLAAFLFAVALVLSKFVYLAMSFVSGFLMISFGSVSTSLMFLVSKEVRKEAFKGLGLAKNKKTAALFFANQAGGALAFILQSFAVSLAPLALVAVINALAGVQYVFVFLFSLLLSLYFPKIIREKISKKIILQKSFAIILIAFGLAILAQK